jgi:hypothetical protein
MRIVLEIGAAGTERTIPEGDMLVIEDKSAAPETEIGIAIAGRGCPNAVFFSSKALLTRSFISSVSLIIVVPPVRLVKKAHLLRCACPTRSDVLSAYASARRPSRASHLNLFDQPGSGSK